MDTDHGVIAHLPLALAVIDERLDVRDASRAAFTLLGRRFHPDDPAKSRRQLAEAIQGDAALNAWLAAALPQLRKPGADERFTWRHDPRTYAVTLSALDPADGPRYALVFEDRTDHIAMERSNARARSYLESIMTSLHIGLIVMDRNLQITNMNRTQEELLKQAGNPVTLLQAVGLTVLDLFPDETEFIDKIKQDVLADGAVCGGITERLQAGDKTFVLAVSFSPLRDENGGITGMIRVCEDVTEREKLEQELRDVESRALEVETIRKVIVTLNHEINNALMAIMGNAEVLLRVATALPAEQRALLATIVEQSEKIARVTRRLATMEKVQSAAYLVDGPLMIDTDSP